MTIAPTPPVASAARKQPTPSTSAAGTAPMATLPAQPSSSAPASAKLPADCQPPTSDDGDDKSPASNQDDAPTACTDAAQLRVDDDGQPSASTAEKPEEVGVPPLSSKAAACASDAADPAAPETPPRPARPNMMSVLGGSKMKFGTKKEDPEKETVVRRSVRVTFNTTVVPGSVWTRIPLRHFSEKNTAEIQRCCVKVTRASDADRKNSSTRLLAEKKAFSLDLLLGGPKGTADQLIGIVLTLPDDSVKGHTAEQILKSLPNEAEWEKILKFRGPTDSLQQSEKLLVEMRHVPTIKEKFMVLDFHLNRRTRAAWIEEKIGIVATAIPAILAATTFHEALSYIVDLFYWMNTSDHSTLDQLQQGFPIHDIVQLLNTNTLDDGPAMNLLVKVIQDERPDLARFPDELGELESLAGISVPAVVAEVNRLEHGLANVVSELESLAPDTGVPDKLREPIAEYHQKLVGLHAEAAEEVAEVRAKVAHFNELVAQFNTFFTEKATTDFAETAGPLLTFINTYSATRKIIVREPIVRTPVYDFLDNSD